MDDIRHTPDMKMLITFFFEKIFQQSNRFRIRLTIRKMLLINDVRCLSDENQAVAAIVS